MRVHLRKYSVALREAGFTGDCAEDGRVDFGSGDSWRPGDPLRDERCERAVAIYAAHDPSPTYAEMREREYPPTGELIVALWELVVEKRPEASDALQAKRAEIKAKYPKVMP